MLEGNTLVNCSFKRNPNVLLLIGFLGLLALCPPLNDQHLPSKRKKWRLFWNKTTGRLGCLCSLSAVWYVSRVVFIPWRGHSCEIVKEMKGLVDSEGNDHLNHLWERIATYFE